MEQKQAEKALTKERKMREKWFEYVLAREQHMTRYQIQQIVSGDEAALGQLEYWRPFDSIDDMQEKCLKGMPEFGRVLTESSEEEEGESWLGDCLQVIEFLVTFGAKLKESLKSEGEEEGGECGIESFDSVLGSVRAFRSGRCFWCFIYGLNEWRSGFDRGRTKIVGDDLRHDFWLSTTRRSVG